MTRCSLKHASPAVCLLRELPALQMDSDLVMTGNSKGRLLLRGTDLVDSSVLLLAEARKSVP